MVGYSTSGRAESGHSLKPTSPPSTIATMSRAVATGRMMKGRDGFIRSDQPGSYASPAGRRLRPAGHLGQGGLAGAAGLVGVLAEAHDGLAAPLAGAEPL